MPGGLELLPTRDYMDNEGSKQWLRYKDNQGIEQSLPKSDPYSEIYLAKDVFYRLIDPSWLGNKFKRGYRSLSLWNYFESNLQDSKNFHEKLKKQVQ